MPPLLHSAKLQPDVTVGEAESDDDEGGDGEVRALGWRQLLVGEGQGRPGQGRPGQGRSYWGRPACVRSCGDVTTAWSEGRNCEPPPHALSRPPTLPVPPDPNLAPLQVETYIIGDRKISLRTSVLEEKATACSMICCYADELKEGFYPYVEQVREGRGCGRGGRGEWRCAFDARGAGLERRGDVCGIALACPGVCWLDVPQVQCWLDAGKIGRGESGEHTSPSLPSLPPLQVTQVMVPLLKFYFHEEVRSAAAQSLPELLRAASLAAAKGLGPDAAFVRSMLGFMWGPLMEAMGKVRRGWAESGRRDAAHLGRGEGREWSCGGCLDEAWLWCPAGAELC